MNSNPLLLTFAVSFLQILYGNRKEMLPILPKNSIKRACPEHAQGNLQTVKIFFIVKIGLGIRLAGSGPLVVLFRLLPVPYFVIANA